MEASTAMSSRLIGAFFVEKGLVTQEQLEFALQKQEESGERLGEIIVAEFGVSRLELASVLAEQWAEFERDSKARDQQAATVVPGASAAPRTEPDGAPEAAGTPVEPVLRRPIGEIFLERGFVSRDDLDKALDVQRETGTRLGEVLVEQGSLSRLDLASALAEQWSSLQKLRPPEPLPAEPWQNGAPTPSPLAAEDVPPDLSRALEELEERMRTLERVSAATPWNEDLRLLGDNVRAALATVEERVTRTATRVDPAQLEALGAALDELRERVQEPAARLDAVEQRLGEVPSVEALEGRLEQRLAELRATLESSAATVPADDLAALGERVDELAARSVTSDELAELRAQVAAPAGGVPSADEVAALQAAVDELAARSASVDELAAVRAQLGEMALRMVVPEALAEVRAELTALSRAVPPAEELDALRSSIETLSAGAAPTDEVASLRALLEELSARAVTAEAVASLRDALAQLSSRTAAADDVASLRTRVDELTAAAVPGEALQALRERLDEMALRVVVPEALAEVRAELAALSRTVVPTEELDALRSSVEALSAGAARAEELESLRARVSELADAAVADAELSALKARVEELAARTVDEQTLVRVQEELTALRERPAVAPGVLDELRDRLGALAEQVAGAPVADPELEARLAAVIREAEVAQAERAALMAQVESLAALPPRVDELAARAADDVSREEHEARVQELLARIDELGARVESVDTRNTEPSGPRLREILDGLRTEIDSLAGRPVVDADALERRFDELARRQVDPAVVDELRTRVAEVAGHVAGAATAESVETRLGELEGRLRGAAPLEEVQLQLARLAESAARERTLLEQELRARVDELAASMPAVVDAAELRATVDELVAREAEASGATAERLAGVEGALSALEGVEWRLQTRLEESVAVRASELEQRLAGSMRRLDALDALKQRIEELRGDLEAQPGSGALDEVAGGLRAELARLAERLGRQERALAELPEPVDPTRRVDDLGLRLDGQARLAAERIAALRDELRARIDEAESTARREAADGVAGVSGRADELAARMEGLAHRDEVQRSIAEQAAAVAVELEQLGRASAEREQAFAEQIAGLADRASVEHIEERLAEHDGRAAEIDERLGSQERGLAGLRAELEPLIASAAGQEEWRLQVESMMSERMAELERRLASESSQARERVERAEQALTTEVGSLAARLDELLGLRHQDLEAARRASDALAARVDELHALRGEDAEAAHAAVDELASRMEELAASLRNEAAAATAAARTVAERIDGLEGLRADDLEVSRVAGAELVARLDDLAIRSAAAAAEADRALRSELYTLAATVEEKEAAGVEAREDLRLELERAASSIGWRLERIEESLASGDQERLRETMAELEQRLDRQVAVQDEQVRVTERALRKGLASLGERLVETQTGYLEAGNVLRRSIERLGAAVVEADARMADQIPVSEVEGYVAFAPTRDGYRLVQAPGVPPELGATVEIEGVEGPLVVTRLGRSPLPLDSRPCAYLDRP